MNRNVESHFSELPKIDIERSIFDRSSSHKTSFNCADLVPFYLDECLPGDTFNITTSAIVRLQTPLTPIMDNIYMDTYWFFVPSRLLWTHWKQFMGENTDSAWIPETEYNVPTLIAPDNGWIKGTIADYFGVPTNIKFFKGNVSALPFRAYAMICDQFFRDQNVSDPLVIDLGDADITGSNGDNYITDVAKGGKPFKVAKYHDYFTSCLPSPLKGEEVHLFPTNVNEVVGSVGIGSVKSVFAPVITRDDYVVSESQRGMTFRNTTGTDTRFVRANTDSAVQWNNSASYGDQVIPNNLWADMSGANITINDLRMSFAVQRFLERNARSGTRYRELLKAHFGVTSSDSRMQIPEYLGGHRFPLSIHQVANQSQGESDFLGDLGAMSNTSDVHGDFVKSFEEHGYVIGLCCVRYDHSYPQGLNRMFSRRRKLDYYFPCFAFLGEQAVLNREIYATGASLVDMSVFGYQERWAEYRYKPSYVSGEMRPGIDNSLASWHLADYYDDLPVLSDGWIREDKNNVDRVLSVQSNVSDQVFCDFYVKNICTRPLPMYSIPGLIDHH